MIRVTRQVLGVAALCGGFLLWNASARGQTSAPAEAIGKGAVIGTGTFTAFVENMDRSLAFFHDVFGMDVPPVPESGQRPYNRANPQLFAMFASLRFGLEPDAPSPNGAIGRVVSSVAIHR